MLISVFDNYFDPATVMVPPNQPVLVTFVNKGVNVHIVEVRGLTPEITLQPGTQGNFTITAQARPYKLYDEIYAGSGMIGVYSGAKGVQQTPASFSQVVTVKSAIQNYRSYVIDQADQLLQSTQLLVTAIEAGNLTTAKQLYPVAHQYYERIEPVAASFGTLDARLDARENDLPANQWYGFHRIEKTLWIDGTTTGLQKYTQSLISDISKLRLNIDTLTLSPTDVVDGAVALLDEAAHNKITGEEDRYSHSDLYDLSANIEGSQAAFEVYKIFLMQKDPALLNEVEAQFQQVETTLKPFRSGNGFVSYLTLTTNDKRTMTQAIDAAGESLSKVAVQLASV